jgi:hypothetical protein
MWNWRQALILGMRGGESYTLLQGSQISPAHQCDKGRLVRKGRYWSIGSTSRQYERSFGVYDVLFYGKINTLDITLL